MHRPTQREPRDHQLNLSLTISEWESIRQRAAALGLRPAHFGRAVLLAPTPALVAASSKANDEAPLVRMLYNQVIRLGTNLNQMMRHLHQTGEPLPADLEPLLNDIRALVNRVPR